MKSKYIGTIHNPDILTNTSVSAVVIKLIISVSFLQSQSPLWHFPLGSVRPMAQCLFQHFLPLCLGICIPLAPQKKHFRGYCNSCREGEVNMVNYCFVGGKTSFQEGSLGNLCLASRISTGAQSTCLQTYGHECECPCLDQDEPGSPSPCDPWHHHRFPATHSWPETAIIR